METTYTQQPFGWSKPLTKTRQLAQQAYRQAPWRIATQRGTLLLIVAILGATTLWVMVSVTVQASSAGLQIQQLESEREELQRQIAGLRTEIAIQTSASKMQQRALDAGFQPLSPENITYVVLPGYQGRVPVIQAPPPGSVQPDPLILPVYKQSLWEWLLQGILEISEQRGAVLP